MPQYPVDPQANPNKNYELFPVNADWGRWRMGAVEWIGTKRALIGRCLRQAVVARYSCRLSGDDIVGQGSQNAGQCVMTGGLAQAGKL